MRRNESSLRHCFGLVMLLVVLAAFVNGPSRADEQSGWRLRVELAVVDPGDDTWQSSSGGGISRAEFDTGGGIGIRGEYQYSPRIGIDFGVLNTASVGLKASSTGYAELDVETFTPLSVGVDIHLTPDKRVDLYVGPQLAFVQYDRVYVVVSPGSTGVWVSIDNDIGVGALIGLDVPLGEERHWAFQTNLRYIKTTMEGTTGVTRVDADFDPVIFGIGFGYRW